MSEEISVCRKCAWAGLSRPVVVMFRGDGYCLICQDKWIQPQLIAMAKAAKFGTLLRHAIRRAGLRSREVAFRAGVSEASMSHYLSEEGPQFPRLDIFAALCEAVGVQPNYLLGYTDPKITALEGEMKALREAMGAVQDVLESYRRQRPESEPQGLRLLDSGQVPTGEPEVNQ